MAIEGGPKRLNAFTVFMIVLALAGGYWMWRFFPAYFNSWTVDHELREAAAATYKMVRLPEPTRSTQLKIIVDHARANIVRLANVTDPDLSIDLNLEDDNVSVSADYSVIVTHPFINKTTKVHFHRVQSENVKRVKWE